MEDLIGLLFFLVVMTVSILAKRAERRKAAEEPGEIEIPPPVPPGGPPGAPHVPQEDVRRFLESLEKQLSGEAAPPPAAEHRDIPERKQAFPRTPAAPPAPVPAPPPPAPRMPEAEAAPAAVRRPRLPRRPPEIVGPRAVPETAAREDSGAFEIDTNVHTGAYDIAAGAHADAYDLPTRMEEVGRPDRLDDHFSVSVASEKGPSVAALFRDRDSLRRAILAREIFGPPRAFTI